MYAPSVGRFLEHDPIWPTTGEANPYLYAKDSPTNFTDPSGLDPVESRLRPGSRVSNLLLRDDQAEAVKKKLASALGVDRIESIAAYRNPGYQYIVLPPEALSKEGHDKIVNALWDYKPGDQMPSLAQTLYRGSVTNPPGYPDTYAVIDPETRELFLSQVADFGSSQVSSGLSKVSPERLDSMVKDGLAQKVGNYIYVAWIDPASKQFHQVLLESYMYNDATVNYGKDAITFTPVWKKIL